MGVEGSSFVVRVQGYPQRKDYTVFCEQAVDGLLDARPNTINEFTRAIAPKIKWYRRDDSPRESLGEPLRFGVLYDRLQDESLGTTLVGRYESSFARALERHWPQDAATQKDLYEQFRFTTHDAKPGDKPILLSQFSRDRGAGKITNNWGVNNSERLWRAITQAFEKSVDEKSSLTNRLNNALECY